MEENVEKITDNEKLLAIIIRSSFNNRGLNFFTPDNFPLQLGIHHRKKDDMVEPHKHSVFTNLNIPAQEFFYLEKGKLEVGIYTNDNELLKKTVLSKGDMILLNCGHSITFLADSKLIELKQGPYRGKDTEKEAIGNNI